MNRIDVHAHLLPGLDDGCRTMEESMACARLLVEAGYSHIFCTPHIWPNLPENRPAEIAQRTVELQVALNMEGIELKVFPGGEINLRPDTMRTDPDDLVSYGMNGHYCLIDLWAQTLPDFFEPAVRWMQSLGLTVVLAHPERMRAIQDEPDEADRIGGMGVLLQGNLHCLVDPPGSMTRRRAEEFLRQGKYFMLGSDLHHLENLPPRMAGLRRAIELVGEDEVDRLTMENPAKLLGIK
ncbi:MAG: hypothetical protein IT446_00595 [Phycisphaerales bacterium]|jgi:protein-tyrosine phosphatase|nr:hypothetical protein [Phycisphaerales bacterium]